VALPRYWNEKHAGKNSLYINEKATYTPKDNRLLLWLFPAS